ncbi:E1-E2 ATPase-domain-containing protein [Aspergillus californicus]
MSADSIDPNKTSNVINFSDDYFKIPPAQLSKLHNPKSLTTLAALGGLRGLEKGLRTDVKKGLRHDGERIIMHGLPYEEEFGANDAFMSRKRVFGDNRLPTKQTSLLRLLWLAYNDRILIMLTIAALFFRPFRSDSELRMARREAEEGRIGCVIILIGILLTVILGALSDYYKERAVAQRIQQTNDREVKVIRSGRLMVLHERDVLVGDVVLLEPGDLVPADGILIDGHNVRCGESPMTGYSDIIRKHGANHTPQATDYENFLTLSEHDPFITSGTRVLEGIGTFLVTATGLNSVRGKTAMLHEQFSSDPPQTATEIRLRAVAEAVSAAIMAMVVIRFILACVDRVPELVRLSHSISTLVFFSCFSTEERILFRPFTALITMMGLKESLEMHRSSLLPRLNLGICLPLPRWQFYHHRPGRNTVTLPLIIKGRTSPAIPDTGADENVITTACASQLGLQISPDTNPIIFQLANGHRIRSCGIIKPISITFAKGKNRPKVQASFRAFPTLAVPIIMGRRFLHETKTLSKYDDRLEEKRHISLFQHAIPRIFHMNAPKQRFRCFLDGVPVYANADTGAEMNLASPEWAARHKMVIKRPDWGYERVMLADGSLARISGQFSARFQVHNPHQKDKGRGRKKRVYTTRQFFILDGLTSDVLLCQDLLLDIKAFKKEKKAFIELDSADCFSDLNLVSWLSKREKRFLTFFGRHHPPSTVEIMRTGSVRDRKELFQREMDREEAREQDTHAQALRAIKLSDFSEPDKDVRVLEENRRHDDVLQVHATRRRKYQPIISGTVRQNTGGTGPVGNGDRSLQAVTT